MSETRTIPNTLRDKYMQERTDLYNLVWKLDDAILTLSTGNVASYSLGNRSISYQNIEQLRTIKLEAEKRIEEIEAYLRGASVRNVSVSTFLSPSILIPRK
jgi:hypothetical protein